MKILVTGVGSLVGQTIAKKLAKRNLVFASYKKSFPKCLKKYKNIKLIKIDLSQNFNLKFDYDFLVHCASIVPVKNFLKSEYTNINVNGFKKLLKICKEKNVRKIVLLSSLSVYGKIKKTSVTEETKLIKPDEYGKSKIKMEYLLKNYCKINLAQGLVLRLPGIIGPSSKNNFLSHAINFIKKKKYIKINNPNLKFNNMAHVDNIADIVANSFFNNKSYNYKVFNVGTKYPIKFIKIFEIMFKKLGIKKNIIINNSSRKGFNLKLNLQFKKRFDLYSTSYALQKFIEENLH
jgi:nucleoside-diphosphate-sugar epimerase